MLFVAHAVLDAWIYLSLFIHVLQDYYYVMVSSKVRTYKITVIIIIITLFVVTPARSG